MRQLAVISVAIAAGFLLVGCSFGHQISVERLGLGDRCANMMKAAMPLAGIEIGTRTAKDTDVNLMVAHVEGTRTDLPKDSQMARELAVECQFDDNILTAFHWTKGGPAH